jgi:hypothetical protein
MAAQFVRSLPEFFFKAEVRAVILSGLACIASCHMFYPFLFYSFRILKVADCCASVNI